MDEKQINEELYRIGLFFEYENVIFGLTGVFNNIKQNWKNAYNKIHRPGRITEQTLIKFD